MVPPAAHNYRVITEARLSEWEVFEAFDAAPECNQALRSLIAKMAHKVVNDPHTSEQAISVQLVYGQCIASDDPRLKGN